MSSSNMVLATSSRRRPAVLATTMRGNGTGPENSSCIFKGVRKRSWGKWVAEIPEPNFGFPIWLGTFHTSVEAAVAYDTAAFQLYGSNAELNLPDYFPVEENQPTDNPVAPPLRWEGDLDDSELWETVFNRDDGEYIYDRNEQEEEKEEELLDEMNQMLCL